MQGSARYNYKSQFAGQVEALLADLEAMLLDGRYILTAEVRAFEEAFAWFNGSRYARGVNSGTDALVIGLMALGVGRGDEVITHANTFHATVAAIDLVGATPVLVDADEHTYLMDTTQIQAAMTRRTRVVIPVHLFGKPTPMLNLLQLCNDADVALMEDAAQAHGAVIHGRRVGTFGRFGCFSFHPSKNLAAAGDAGALVSEDAALIGRVDQLRALGQAGQNEHVVVGLNSKLDALQARILSCKLGHLDEWNRARARAAEWYRAALADLPVSFQATSPDETHVYHLFQVRTRRRDSLLRYLHSRSVDAVVRYPVPIPLQPAFERWGWRRGQFPVAEQLASELLCLPIRPDMEQAEVDFVSGCVRTFFAEG